jgi:hypothetical protein
MEHTLTKISQKDKACYDGCSTNREIQITKGRDIQVQEQLGQGLFPIVVTECLSTHRECTQEYSDITNSFRIRCICSCHHKGGKQQWWQNYHYHQLDGKVKEW